MKMAASYEAEAANNRSSLSSLFYDEKIGSFEDGFVFRVDPDAPASGERDHDLGRWRCDLANQNKLTWSDEVYDLFGVRPPTPVEREWAIRRYTDRSRRTLERVRENALRYGCGFILDAEINPEGRRPRWMRVFAVPMSDQNRRIIGLQGVKRDLS